MGFGSRACTCSELVSPFAGGGTSHSAERSRRVEPPKIVEVTGNDRRPLAPSDQNNGRIDECAPCRTGRRPVPFAVAVAFAVPFAVAVAFPFAFAFPFAVPICFRNEKHG